MKEHKAEIRKNLDCLYGTLGKNPIDFMLNYFFEKEKKTIGITKPHDVVAEVSERVVS